jgi:hypothetical protein
MSLKWGDVPLRSFETAIKYIEGNETTTGLKVQADLKPAVMKQENVSLMKKYGPSKLSRMASAR